MSVHIHSGHIHSCFISAYPTNPRGCSDGRIPCRPLSDSTGMDLDDKDIRFYNRLLKRKKYFFLFSILSSVTGVVFLVYHLIARDLDGARFVLAVFILLAGRSNLRQYKISLLLSKIKPLINTSKQDV
ncbi:MAG: hypothetical protein H7843_00985 [Nitrospirota bacterium]